MAFYHAPDGKTYASRKRYADHLRREQRRFEKVTFGPKTAGIPQFEPMHSIASELQQRTGGRLTPRTARCLK